MLTALRKSFKSPLYRIAMWIILLALGGAFSIIEIGRSLFGAKENWALQINGDYVGMSDYLRRLQLFSDRISHMKQISPEYARLILQSLGSHAQPSVAAQDYFLRQTIINQLGNKLSLDIPSSMVAMYRNNSQFLLQYLEDLIPPYAFNHQTGTLDWGLVRSHLQKNKISLAELDERIKKGIKQEKVMDLLASAAYIPEFELKDRFEKDYMARTFSVLELNPDQFTKQAQKETVSPEKLKAYFDKHKRNFLVPEKRSVTSYNFTADKYQIQISDQEITNYYEKHKSEYIDQPMQVTVRRILFKATDSQNSAAQEEKARAIYQQLLSQPDQFEKLAKEHSQDADSAKNGGLLKPFKKGTHSPAFDRAAFTLKEDGAISSVIATDEGLEILQRVSRTTASYKKIEQVKEEISKKIKKNRFEQDFGLELRKACQEPNADRAVAQIAKAQGIRPEEHAQLENNKLPLAKLAFSLDKGQTGCSIQGAYALVVKVNDISPEHEPTFEQVESQVKDAWIQSRAQELIKAKAQEIEQAVNSGKSLESFKQFGTFKTLDNIMKSNAENIRELDNIGAPVPQLFSLLKGHALQWENSKDSFANMPLQVPGQKKTAATYIARLDAVDTFNMEKFKGKKERIIQGMADERKNMVSSVTIASLSKNATIKTNQSLSRLEE